ncbi:MAG: hypothetical protein WEE66_03130 [Actinomycetota bacterium]
MSCMIGSRPASTTDADPATGDISALATASSPTFTASMQPT